jgi:hypothetical protein
MYKVFQVFAYIFLVIIGGYMFGITADGHIIKICIACNSFFTNVLGIVAMITGITGLAVTVSFKKEAFKGSLNANA